MKREEMSEKTNKNTVLLPNEVEFEKLTIGEEPQNKMTTGAKLYAIKYEGAPLRIQTPLTVAPFGATSSKKDADINDPEEKKLLEFNMDRESEIFTFASKFDEFNVNVTKNNLKKWFHLDKTGPVAEALAEEKYGGMVKGKDDEKYPPRLRTKLPFYNGKPNFDVIDMKTGQCVDWFSETGKEYKKKYGDKEVVVKEYNYDWSKWNAKYLNVQGIIECEGYWVAPSGCYCTWKLVKLRYELPEQYGGKADFRDMYDGDAFGDIQKNVNDINDMLDATQCDEDDE